jgi:hypothetical protein
MEMKLANHIRKLDELYYGLSFKQVWELAYDFAVQNNVHHRFSSESKMAGKHWLKSFLKRHHLSTHCTAERCSAARASGFNRVKCAKYFSNLAALYEKYQFPPSSIYNMDESGISSVKWCAEGRK